MGSSPAMCMPWGDNTSTVRLWQDKVAEGTGGSGHAPRTSKNQAMMVWSNLLWPMVLSGQLGQLGQSGWPVRVVWHPGQAHSNKFQIVGLPLRWRWMAKLTLASWHMWSVSTGSLTAKWSFPPEHLKREEQSTCKIKD